MISSANTVSRGGHFVYIGQVKALFHADPNDQNSQKLFHKDWETKTYDYNFTYKCIINDAVFCQKSGLVASAHQNLDWCIKFCLGARAKDSSSSKFYKTMSSWLFAHSNQLVVMLYHHSVSYIRWLTEREQKSWQQVFAISLLDNLLSNRNQPYPVLVAQT